jgi:hypothetical protein
MEQAGKLVNGIHELSVLNLFHTRLKITTSSPVKENTLAYHQFTIEKVLWLWTEKRTFGNKNFEKCNFNLDFLQHITLFFGVNSSCLSRAQCQNTFYGHN